MRYNVALPGSFAPSAPLCGPRAPRTATHWRPHSLRRVQADHIRIAHAQSGARHCIAESRKRISVTCCFSCRKSFASFARRATGHACACLARAPRCACTRTFRCSAAPPKTSRAEQQLLRVRAHITVPWRRTRVAPMPVTRLTSRTCSRMAVPAAAGRAHTSCPESAPRCETCLSCQRAAPGPAAARSIQLASKSA